MTDMGSKCYSGRVGSFLHIHPAEQSSSKIIPMKQKDAKYSYPNSIWASDY